MQVEITKIVYQHPWYVFSALLFSNGRLGVYFITHIEKVAVGGVAEILRGHRTITVHRPCWYCSLSGAQCWHCSLSGVDIVHCSVHVASIVHCPVLSLPNGYIFKLAVTLFTVRCTRQVMFTVRCTLGQFSTDMHSFWKNMAVPLSGATLSGAHSVVRCQLQLCPLFISS